MHLYRRASLQRGLDQRRKVDVGGDVDEAGRREGRDVLVGADAAQGVDGDGGGWAVVDDEGGAGWWEAFRVRGVR